MRSFTVPSLTALLSGWEHMDLTASFYLTGALCKRYPSLQEQLMPYSDP